MSSQVNRLLLALRTTGIPRRLNAQSIPIDWIKSAAFYSICSVEYCLYFKALIRESGSNSLTIVCFSFQIQIQNPSGLRWVESAASWDCGRCEHSRARLWSVGRWRTPRQCPTSGTQPNASGRETGTWVPAREPTNIWTLRRSLFTWGNTWTYVLSHTHNKMHRILTVIWF